MTSHQVLVGFDGFIDEILECVDTRRSPESYEPIKTISDFSKRIASSIGKSGNIEWICKSIQPGGNAPLLASALIHQNCKVHFIGACGTPAASPLFENLKKSCETFVSIAQPGYTHAIEFQDGKLFLGKTDSLTSITPKTLLSYINKERLLEILYSIDALAFVNWTMTPHMNDIWEWIEKNYKPQTRKPFCLIDLADPRKRTQNDLKEALHRISRLSSIFQICLSANHSETEQIAEALSISSNDLHHLGKMITEKLNIFCTLIHTKKACSISTSTKAYHLNIPYIDNPKRLTGAGDHFNAGCIEGYLKNLDIKEALSWAAGTALFLVQNGTSPSQEEVTKMLSSLNVTACKPQSEDF